MYDCFDGSSIKKCEQDLEKIKRAIRDDGIHTNNLLKDFANYLKDQEKNIKGVKSLYDRDRATLMSQNSAGIRMNIGENGRATDNDQYLALLVRNPQNRNLLTGPGPALRNTADYGDLVLEHIHAQEAIVTLATDMSEYKKSQDAFNAEFLKSVGKFTPPDTSTNPSQYLGPAATAAGALGSVTGATSAATSALPLAAAAAGAASMASSVGKSSSGGGDGSGASSGPAAALLEATTAGGGTAKSDAGQVLVAPTAPVAPITEIITKTEKTENRTPSSDTFIPSKFGGSGSSTSEGKAGATTAAANGVTMAAGGGGGEDLLHSFNDAIKPIPAPTKKKDDGMAGMNDLFGSMTKMFNFDAPPPSTDTAPPPASADAGTANGEFNDGFQYGSGGGASASSGGGEEQAFAGDAENASPEAGEMVQFGSIGTPLFQRVHNRHRVAMEKGWLVQEFGKLPR
ncbi:MAG: hypothetical protein EOP11_13370 [Proteobacteria bacterium]|nr:MAG: hypothetical protein EOP11_13370 [Pseudomonadota bacterium]